jgi:type IV secretion system protein TrbL
MFTISRKVLARVLLASVLVTGAVAVFSALAPAALAQATPPTQPLPPGIETGPSDILQDYQNAMSNWQSAATNAAATLFALLAAIEVTWSAIVLALEKSDMQAWVATVMKKLMSIGIFFALLKYGVTWLPDIINSFVHIGMNGSGQTALNPSTILVEGLNICGKLFSTAANMGLSFDFGTALCLVVAGVGIFLSFCVVCIHFIMAMVESYIVIGAGYIFLGFGGSRWTTSYVERYIGLAVNVGVRIMVLYLLIGLGQTFANQWETRAASIQFTSAGVQTAFGLMASTLIYAAVCWTAPKLVGSIMGGSPSLSGGDLVGAAVAAGAGVATAAAVLASGGAAAAGALAELGAATTITEGGALGAGAMARAGEVASSGPSPATTMSAVGSGMQPPPPGGGYTHGGAASFFPPGGGAWSGLSPATTVGSGVQPPPPAGAQSEQAASRQSAASQPQMRAPISRATEEEAASGDRAAQLRNVSDLLQETGGTLRTTRDRITNIHQQLPSDSGSGGAPPSGNIGHSTD